MIKLKNMKSEEIGDMVCRVFNEELNIKMNFDYLEEENDTLFRFVLEDGSYKDYLLSIMIKEFKTLDFLVCNLLAYNRARTIKKRA